MGASGCRRGWTPTPGRGYDPAGRRGGAARRGFGPSGRVVATPILLGIEIGGTKLQVGAGRGDGTLLGLTRLEVARGATAEDVRAQVARGVAACRAGLGGLRIGAVGVGFGGPVDGQTGRVTLSNQVPGWAGFPLADWVREKTGADRVVLANDADAAALGEARFGAGVGRSPLLYVNSGSGIGGGLVVDGVPYAGSGRGALEIGHLWIEPAGDGRTGRTLEDLASGWAIARAGRAWAEGRPGSGIDPEGVTAETVFALAARGEPGALAIVAAATRAMGVGLAHAVTLLAPRRVVLGGGVSLASDELWRAPILRELEARVFPPFRGTFDVVTAALGEAVVVHGALALARETWRASRRPPTGP